MWPPSDLLSIAGLAQHYGLPTRLMDWTYSALIAAYFATSGVIRLAHAASQKADMIREYCDDAGLEYKENVAQGVIMGKERYLAVWAFSSSLEPYFKYHPTRVAMPYQIVTVPYATNPNIQAQQGVFTIYNRVPLDPASEVDRRSFDEVLSEAAIAADLPPVPLFLCFKLPWEKSFELLRLLAKFGVNGSTIYPGYRGACETVSEKSWWWDREL